MNIEFEVKHQKLTRIDDEEIASFTRNYIYVTIDFDKTWKDLKKYCLFVTPNGDRYVTKLGYGKKLSCIIPEQVLQQSYFNISVFADDLLTSTQETVLVSSSGYISDIDDLEEDDVIESNIDMIYTRKKHYDETCDGRANRFEIAEHPYY